MKITNLGNVDTQVAMNSRTANADEHAEIPRGPSKNKNSTSSRCNGKIPGSFCLAICAVFILLVLEHVQKNSLKNK